MKIIVCIKQIPDTNDVRWSKDNNIIRDGLISVLNPYDIEGLLTAKSISNADITLLSMGPDNAVSSMRYALALAGARGVLLSDKKFSAADTLATAKTLSYAIKNVIKEYDLIITGQFALDGDTAQTPYSLANILEIPSIGYVTNIDEIKDGEIIVTSTKDDGIYKTKGKFPLLLSVSKFSGCSKKPLIKDYVDAQDKEIKILNAADIQAEQDKIGIKGSPTYVNKAFRPENKRNCTFIKEPFCFRELI